MGTETTKSLAIAHQLKADGFSSLLEAQPDMEREFIVLWQKSNSIRECRRQLVTRFPDGQVPSVNALSTYLTKNLKHSTIDSRTPEYVKLAARFDSVKQMYLIAGEAEQRYKYAVATNANWRTQSRQWNNMLNATERVLNMEIKLGLRSIAQAPDVAAYQTSSTTAEADQTETLEQAVDVVESYDRFKAKVLEVQNGPQLGKAY
jgi:hypothetical protein